MTSPVIGTPWKKLNAPVSEEALEGSEDDRVDRDKGGKPREGLPVQIVDIVDRHIQIGKAEQQAGARGVIVASDDGRKIDEQRKTAGKDIHDRRRLRVDVGKGAYSVVDQNDADK